MYWDRLQNQLAKQQSNQAANESNAKVYKQTHTIPVVFELSNNIFIVCTCTIYLFRTNVFAYCVDQERQGADRTYRALALASRYLEIRHRIGEKRNANSDRESYSNVSLTRNVANF